MPKKPRKLNVSKEVKAIARERVGSPAPSRPLTTKDQRKKPKYKPTDSGE